MNRDTIYSSADVTREVCRPTWTLRQNMHKEVRRSLGSTAAIVIIEQTSSTVEARVHPAVQIQVVADAMDRVITQERM